MKTARLLVECLEAEGVDRIFGIPGEENLDVMDEIHSAGIEFVLTRHEQAAAFMAAAVGRLTGRPGVCLSTLGPGATNLVTGVADAYLSNLPMVALVAQAGAARRDPPQKQVLDLMAMFKPLTKSTIDVPGPGDVPGSVRMAFSMSASERSGPVVLQLPEDVMRGPAEGEPLPKSAPARRLADGSLLDDIKKALASCERPLCLVGHGALRAGAIAETRRFCDAWGIPSGCTWMAAGAVAFDDPLSLGTVGMRNSDLVRECYEEADLVISIGYDVTEFQPQFWNRGAVKRVLHVGESEAGRAKGVSFEVQAIGDLRSSLSSMADGAIRKEDWAAEHRRRMRSAVGTPSVGPKGLVQALRRQLGRRDVLVSDVGAHLIWLAKFFPAYEANTLLLQNGLISMGVALPTAIAAKLVMPERHVVAVVGDGGFLMSSSELETAKRLNVNFVTVIFNDGGLGLIREKMRRSLGKASNVDLGSPDIPAFARSFGAEGHSVQPPEFEAVLQDCLRRDALAVIEVEVDYSHNGDLF